MQPATTEFKQQWNLECLQTTIDAVFRDEMGATQYAVPQMRLERL